MGIWIGREFSILDWFPFLLHQLRSRATVLEESADFAGVVAPEPAAEKDSAIDCIPWRPL